MYVAESGGQHSVQENDLQRRKGEEQGLGLDQIGENPSAYCLVML